MKVLLLLFLFSSAQAETYLDLNIASRHVNNGKDNNERNLGLGITHNRWSFGFYENSQYHNSNYLLYGFSKNVSIGEVGVRVGGITGYDYARVLPVVLPYIALGDDYRLLFNVLPVVVSVTLQVRF